LKRPAWPAFDAIGATNPPYQVRRLRDNGPMAPRGQKSEDSAPRHAETAGGEDPAGSVSRAERPDRLAAALAEQNISLPDEQVAALENYCLLLWDWNEKLNLTRHLDYRTFVQRDVLDSLVFSKALEQGERILDVGTGGGVPGIPLAILRPDLRVELCESITKKARAVNDMIGTLKLPATVHHARAQDLLAAGRTYDTLVIRAVARLDKLLTWFGPHWGRFRRMLVLKGPSWVEERRAARERRLLANLDLRRLTSYIIPGTQAESVLLQLAQKEDAQSPA